MNLLIKNGRVIDPENCIDEVADVLVTDGKITKVGKGIEVNNADDKTKIIDAAGMWVTPGLIDLHVHLREPGFEHKETIRTGALSAAAGGFTTICCMPNTDPVVDNEIIVEYIKMKAEKESAVNILPIGSITKGQAGLELSNIGKMAESGICAISEDGKSVTNPALFKTALKYAGMFGLPVFDHCEEPALSGKGLINAGDRASLLGLAGISTDSEEVIVARDIILASSAGAKLHICHVSTAGSVQLIREAKARGEKVTCEVTPHHFTLCDEDITDYDTNYKMSPPLRGKLDLEAIKQGLKDGTIDAIATDHAPHHFDEKNCEFENAPNGVVGLETAVALGLTELAAKDILTPSQLIEKMSTTPAKIIGINKGALTEGFDADITIIDPAKTIRVEASKFLSKGRNTPFDGMKLTGDVVYTIILGKIVYNSKESVK